MQLKKLLNIINKVLPADTALEGDRIGLQVQAGNENIRDLLVCMEINGEVVNEAQSLECECIVAFHPLIYIPLKQISDNERVGKLVSDLIRKSVSFISVHTTFDAFAEGTSKILSDKLGLIKKDFLAPDANRSGFGVGVIAEPERPLSEIELLEKVAAVCKSPLRYCTAGGKKIRKIAIVGGSGTSFLDDALKSGADAFITADITYHKFHQVEGSMMLIDPGHYEMEQFVAQGIADVLKEAAGNELRTIKVSKTYTNPVRYFPGNENYENEQKHYLINKNNSMV